MGVVEVEVPLADGVVVPVDFVTGVVVAPAVRVARLLATCLTELVVVVDGVTVLLVAGVVSAPLVLVSTDLI
jgi:hypothetical protein